MRILYVAHKHEYGVVARGLSFEHNNFYVSLVADGHEVDYFDLTAESAQGTAALNERLLRRARETQPDLVFCFMFEDELDKTVVREITESGTPTYNWFADDHWRFETFSRDWAPCFTWVSTTAESALSKYAAAGIRNVLKTQWAAADSLYRPAGLPIACDVSFVGQVYGDRRGVIDRIRAQGVDVATFGSGWALTRRHELLRRVPLVRRATRSYVERVNASTRIEVEEMVRLFEQSRINLNLTEASQGDESQIKGRTFEVPACRGFLLSGPAAGIEEYFEPGAEIVLYGDEEEALQLIRHYLDNESARAAIAEAGYRRTVAEHTYRARFRALFRQMGLA